MSEKEPSGLTVNVYLSRYRWLSVTRNRVAVPVAKFRVVIHEPLSAYIVILIEF